MRGLAKTLAALSVLWTPSALSQTPPLLMPYSSTFIQPESPLIPTEFTANFMQHKYDSNTSHNHPTAGFGYWSPSLRMIRVDAASNGSLEASFFDFRNVSAQGEVNNTVFMFQGGVKQSQSSCASFIQVPGFQLFAPDMLNTTQAVFIGIKHDELYGPLNAWQFLVTPPGVLTTAYLDANNTLVRYDFSAPGQPARTFTTTRLFNIVLGPVDPAVFESDCF